MDHTEQQHAKQYSPPPYDAPPMKPRRRWLRWLALAAGLIFTFVIGITIGSGTSKTTTLTKTVTVPGPTITKTVPGPATTVTATPPPPPTGSTVATFHGSGNQNTGQFNVPSSGDYVMSWQYGNNTDPSMGGATNFSISPANSSGYTGNLPNDIQTSGSGSTEVTGDSGTDSFNVQATGWWTITVKSAP